MADNVTSREPRYVGFWMRVFASIIDTLILVVFIGLIAFAVYGTQYLRLHYDGKTTLFDFLVQVLLPALAVIVFWRYRGATPGKMLRKLQIVRADDYGEISIGMALLRYVGYFISAIALGLGFLSIIWDAEKRGWHDKIAGTRVIRVR